MTGTSKYTGEERSFGALTLLIVLYISVTTGFTDLNIFKVIHNNLLSTMFAVCLYIPIGLGWSVFKIYERAKKFKQNVLDNKIESIQKLEEYKKQRDRFSKEECDMPIEDLWKSHIKKEIADFLRTNKQNIIFWSIYWPFSMISYILKDLLYDIFKYFVDKISGVYEKIVNKVFKDIL